MKKIIVIILLSISFNCFSQVRLPTQNEVDKYCICLRLKVDGDCHYFVLNNIKEFTEESVVILFGKYREKQVTFFRDEILNFEDAKDEYEGRKNR